MGEFAVRVALGASRWDLLRSQLAEATFLDRGRRRLRIVDGVHRHERDRGGDSTAHCGLRPWFNLTWRLEAEVIAAALGSAVIALSIAGVIPAHMLAKLGVSKGLSAHSGITVVPGWRGRGNLIALQVGGSFWLFLIALLANFLVQRATARVTGSGGGFDMRATAIAHIPFEGQQYDANRVQAVTGRYRS
jgi:hypothetical protein